MGMGSRTIGGAFGMIGLVAAALAVGGCAGQAAPAPQCACAMAAPHHASAAPAAHDAHAASAPAGHGAHAAPAINPDDALAEIVAGNRRFVAGKAEHPHQDAARRTEIAKGQHPRVIVLACADSRVAPEVVFDTGVGDVFVVRVAGNIVDDAVLGSIEYAAEHLHAPLVVVMGHERCGAVAATVDAVLKGGEAPGHIGALLNPIKPAVTAARAHGDDDLVDRAVDENVTLVVRQIRTSQPLLARMIAEGHLKVIGGRYDLDTGEFALQGDH